MTSILKKLAVLAPVLLAVAAYGEGIVGSPHDFSAETWSDGEICKPCHTPHNAIAGDLSGRLWNHTLSTATYTLHAGSNPDVTKAGGQEDMDRVSRLCLSCHDGTVALDSFGGKTDGTTMIASVEEDADLGTDLSNDHPVGVDIIYQEEKAHGGHYSYQPISVAKAAGLRFNTVEGTRTYTDQSGATVTANNEAVGCNTCHDVHNGAGFEPLLRTTNDASNLCLSCHTK